MEKNQYILDTLEVALDIMDLLDIQGEMGLSEICRALDVGKTRAFRIMSTLVSKRYVIKTKDAQYRLGVKFAAYGEHLTERVDLANELRQFLRRLRDKYNETVHLAVLVDNANIVFMGKEMGNSAFRMGSKVGALMPTYCTSTGKVLLASLEPDEMEEALSRLELKKLTDNTIISRDKLRENLFEIRKNGYGTDNEESEVGLMCFAAPIKDYTGKTIAAISMSGPTARMQVNRNVMIKAILETAHDASEYMGFVV